MRNDLAARMAEIMRGNTPKKPVSAGAPVTRPLGNRSKDPWLLGLPGLPVKSIDCPKDGKMPVTSPVTSPPDPDEAELAERAGMAAGGVPEIYLDAWARLQCQRPLAVDPDEWEMAVNDAGVFLDTWGAEAAAWGWTPGELFDVSRGDRAGGLVWFIRGGEVRAFGREHAAMADGSDLKNHYGKRTGK